MILYSAFQVGVQSITSKRRWTHTWNYSYFSYCVHFSTSAFFKTICYSSFNLHWLVCYKYTFHEQWIKFILFL